VDCANIVRSGRSTRDGHERGRDKLSDKALRRAFLESDLPQIAAGVFQADDGHGGIAGDFARGVRAVHVLVLAYWHHMHAARLFLAFIHGCPLRAMSGRS